VGGWPLITNSLWWEPHTIQTSRTARRRIQSIAFFHIPPTRMFYIQWKLQKWQYGNDPRPKQAHYLLWRGTVYKTNRIQYVPKIWKYCRFFFRVMCLFYYHGHLPYCVQHLVSFLWHFNPFFPGISYNNNNMHKYPAYACSP
jgi:hypothetical protein